MRVIGLMAIELVEVGPYFPMARHMMVTGRTTNVMEVVSFMLIRERYMKVNGKMTNEMDTESNAGRTARSTKVVTIQMPNTEQASSNFPMIANTKASL